MYGFGHLWELVVAESGIDERIDRRMGVEARQEIREAVPPFGIGPVDGRRAPTEPFGDHLPLLADLLLQSHRPARLASEI